MIAAPADTLPAAGRLVAVDIGGRRIGLAISDPTQTIAQPLVTLTRRAGKRFPYARLESHLAEAAGVLVGLPLTPDGTEGPAAREAREVAQTIAHRFHVPVQLWDERFTTARALRVARETGAGGRGRKEVTDRLAAAVLLQQFLEARRAGTAP